jgi:hypothetical protein
MNDNIPGMEIDEFGNAVAPPPLGQPEPSRRVPKRKIIDAGVQAWKGGGSVNGVPFGSPYNFGAEDGYSGVDAWDGGHSVNGKRYGSPYMPSTNHLLYLLTGMRP